MTQQQAMREMVREAKKEGNFVRVFDIRYAHEGIPEIRNDHILFRAGSFEVLETGRLNKATKLHQKMIFPVAIPWNSVNLFEISKGHK